MTSNPSGRGKCICQICTCGRHRCPHNRGTLGSETPVRSQCVLKSEYQQVYENFKGQPRREAFRPAMRPHTSAVPMATGTTYNSAYVKLEPVTAVCKRPREYHAPTQKMDDLSTYNHDYIGKEGQRSESFKPNHQYSPSSTKFQTDTMYRNTFREFCPSQRAWCRSTPIRHQESIGREVGPMDARSVMKEDFVAHPDYMRSTLIRPNQDSHQGSPRGKFNDNTTYKVEFIVKEPQQTAACKPKHHVPPSCPFEGQTTVMADYQPHPYHPRQPSFKPQVKKIASGGKFSDSTTASVAYQPWPVQKIEKPAWAVRRTSEISSTPFIKTSSYQDDYIEHAGFVRAELACPGNTGEMTLSHGPQQAPFVNTTQYREQFNREYGTEKAKSFKLNHVYEPPREPMQAESSYQANYQGKYCPPARKCAPNNRNNGEGQRHGMHFNTTYVDDYTGLRPCVCPAKDLATANAQKVDRPASSTFVNAGIYNGHHYYVAQPKVKDAGVKDAGVKVAGVTDAGVKDAGVKVKCVKITLPPPAMEKAMPLPEPVLA